MLSCSSLYFLCIDLLIVLQTSLLFTPAAAVLRTEDLGKSTQATASLAAQTGRRLPATREVQLRSLGREDPLEKEMATHSSTLA